LIRDLIAAASTFGGGLLALFGIGAAAQGTEIAPLAVVAGVELQISTAFGLVPAGRAPDLAAADRVLLFTGLLLIVMVLYAWANHVPRVEREKA
jgi:hypothetical protein